MELDRRLNNLQILTIVNKIQPREVSKFVYNALRNLFEIATWLKNFSVMNGLAYDRLITKCSEKIHIDKKQCPSLLKEIEKFLTDYGKLNMFIIIYEIVQLIENYRNVVVKLFADLFYNGNPDTSVRNIKIVSPFYLIKYFSTKFFGMLFLLIFMAYFLLTYLPGKNYK